MIGSSLCGLAFSLCSFILVTRMCDEILLAPSANIQNEIRKRRNKASLSTVYGNFLKVQYHESNWGYIYSERVSK